MKLLERCVFFDCVTYPPSDLFGNANMKEQCGMYWSQRGSDDIMTNQCVTTDVSIVENRAKPGWVGNQSN